MIPAKHLISNGVTKKRPFSSGPTALSKAAALTLIMLAGSMSSEAVTLSSNLDKPPDGIEDITSSRWLASKFTTDDQTYLVNQITLRLQRNIAGSVVAAIYTDGGGKPGELVGILGAPGPIGGLLSDVVFKGSGSGVTSVLTNLNSAASFEGITLPDGINASDFAGANISTSSVQPEGIALEPGTTYWVVTQAPTGEFASGYTDSEIGTGVGYTSEWAHSENAGATWTVLFLSPLFLGVDADPYQPVTLLEFRIDQEAIASSIFSGLPMAMAQREIVFSLAENATRDVNSRLFRLRSGEQGLREEQGDKEEESPVRRWEFFASGQYGANDTEVIMPLSGFQSDIFTETAGVEFHATRQLTFGAAISLLQSENKLGLGVGDVDITGTAISTYTSFVHKNFYVDALYNYGNYDHVMRRATLFGDTANAEPESRSHTLQLNLGYNIEAKGFVTGPFASLDYVTGDLDAYSETNGGTTAVNVDGQNFDSLVSEIGWQASYPFYVGKLKIIPQVRLSWIHEFLNESEDVTADLKASPYSIGTGGGFVPVGSFSTTATTQQPGEDSMNIGVGFSVRCTDRISFFADYDVRFFQQDSMAQFVSLTGTVEF